MVQIELHYNLSEIHFHHLSTEGAPPRTLPPETSTVMSNSSIWENLKSFDPTSPNQSSYSSSGASPVPMPESSRPLDLEFLTFVISASRLLLTSAAGSAV